MSSADTSVACAAPPGPSLDASGSAIAAEAENEVPKPIQHEFSSEHNHPTAPLVTASVPAKSSLDAAKSLNESNNKIIKELDDETAKTFPQILMEILTNDEDSDTIAWLPHGRSFIIYKKKKFAAQVLVKYFKATKFTSFTRKLNRWGFTRVTRGTEMGSYFHKMFLRDNPELCLRMSSHTSSKYQHSHHEIPMQHLPNPPHMHNQLIMNPGGVPGFVPPALGMPVMPFPFYGMPGMAQGAAVAPPGGIPVTNPAANLPTPPTNAAEFSQQNQYINQQLQHLQWQQFQLQQYQHQQIQAAAAAATNTTTANNHGVDVGINNAPYPQPPAPGGPTSPGGNIYPSQPPLQPSTQTGNATRQHLTGTQPTGAEHSPTTDQSDTRRHSSPGHPGQPLPPQEPQPPQLAQQQQHPAAPLLHPPQHAGGHPPQQHPYYSNQQLHAGAVQQAPNPHSYSQNPQYQYGQQQSHLPLHSHSGVSNGPNNPPPMNHQGGQHYAGPQPTQVQSHPYPYQYTQQNPYLQHNPQGQPQQQQQQQQQQHYNPPIHPSPSTAGPNQTEMPPLPPSSQPLSTATLTPPTSEAVEDNTVDSLVQGDEGNEPEVVETDDGTEKGDDVLCP